MTMLRLSAGQRRLITEKLPDLANLGVAGLVFTQLLGEGVVSFNGISVGLALWVLVMAFAFTVAHGDGE